MGKRWVGPRCYLDAVDNPLQCVESKTLGSSNSEDSRRSKHVVDLVDLTPYRLQQEELSEVLLYMYTGLHVKYPKFLPYFNRL